VDEVLCRRLYLKGTADALRFFPYFRHKGCDRRVVRKRGGGRDRENERHLPIEACVETGADIRSITSAT